LTNVQMVAASGFEPLTPGL